MSKAIPPKPPLKVVSAADKAALGTDAQAAQDKLAGLTHPEIEQVLKTGSLIQADGTSIKASGESTTVKLKDGSSTSFNWQGNVQSGVSSLADGASAAFGLSTSQSGNGAPWVYAPSLSALADEPKTPAQKLAHDEAALNWAQRGLAASKEPAAKGTFGGRTTDQWILVVQRETAIVAANPGAPKLPAPPQLPPPLLSASQAADLLKPSTPQDDASWQSDGFSILSGNAGEKPKDTAQAGLVMDLQALKFTDPPAYTQACQSLANTYGPAVSTNLINKINNSEFVYKQAPGSQPPGWFNKAGQTAQPNEVFNAFKGAGSWPDYPKQANLTTPQSIAAAKALTSTSGFAQPSWLQDAKDIVSAKNVAPNPSQLAGFGTNLLQASHNAPAVYKQLMASLSATYGSSKAAAIDGEIKKAPFAWNKVGGKQGWYDASKVKPKTEQDVFDYFNKAAQWPFESVNTVRAQDPSFSLISR